MFFRPRADTPNVKDSNVIPFPPLVPYKRVTPASRASQPVLVMPLRTVDVKSPAIGLLDELGDWLSRLGSRMADATSRYAAQMQAHRSRRTAAEGRAR